MGPNSPITHLALNITRMISILKISIFVLSCVSRSFSISVVITYSDEMHLIYFDTEGLSLDDFVPKRKENKPQPIVEGMYLVNRRVVVLVVVGSLSLTNILRR